MEIVKLLLDKGADVNQKTMYSNFKWCEYLSLILAGHSKNSIEKYTKELTPLHIAVKKNHVELVQFLLSNGANIKSRTKFNSRTPLHYAVLKNHQCFAFIKPNKAFCNKRNSKC